MRQIMTYQEFIEQNPIIADITKTSHKQNRVIQGEFFKTHTFIFDSLSERMKQIMQMRYGIYDGNYWTLDAIANKMGLSRERIKQLEKNALQELGRHHRVRLMMQYDDSTFDKSLLGDFKSLLCQDIVAHISDEALEFLDGISIDELKFRYYGSNKSVPTNRLKSKLEEKQILTCKDLILYLQNHEIIADLQLSFLSYKILVYAICDLVYGKNADINLQDIFIERDRHQAELYQLEKQEYLKAIKQQEIEKQKRLEQANQHPENVTLEDLDFDKSLYICLKRANIHTLADLIKYCGIKKNIRTIRMLGKTREDIVFEKMKQLGLDLNEKVDEYRAEQCQHPETMPIEILELSLRVYNALKRKRINTIDELVDFYFNHNNSLQSISWMGTIGEAEILTKLREKGVDLPKNETLTKM